VVLVGAVVAGGALWFNHVTQKIDKSIERIGDPFADLPEASRPVVEPRAGKAVNILMVGSDSRISAGDPSQWVAGAQRTDAIMVLHLPADRSGATIISIPRDSWVDIPGHGKAKINAAFSWGGPPLMIRTVEQYTHVRIDHFAVLDFTGFVSITDALGGVKITIPKSTHDMRSNFKAGTYVMDGKTALNYVRQRHGLPGGDFDREKRQQNWIRAVARQMLSKGTLTDPTMLTNALEALGKSVETDDAFTIGEMQSVALASRNVRSSDLMFMTTPVAGTGRSPDGKQSIVLLDTPNNVTLWKAVAADNTASWLATHDPNTLGETVR